MLYINIHNLYNSIGASSGSLRSKRQALLGGLGTNGLKEHSPTNLMGLSNTESETTSHIEFF